MTAIHHMWYTHGCNNPNNLTTKSRNLYIIQQLMEMFVLFSCLVITDIEKRFQNSCITLCNGVVSHEAPIGGIRVFTDYTHRNKRKQNTSTIFAHRVAFEACLSSQSDRSTYVPDEPQLLVFWSQEKPEYPNCSPTPG